MRKFVAYAVLLAVVFLTGCQGAGDTGTNPGMPDVQQTPSAITSPITVRVPFDGGLVIVTITQMWGAPGSTYDADALCEPRVCFFIDATFESKRALKDPVSVVAFLRARGSDRATSPVLGARLGKKPSIEGSSTQYLRFTEFEPGDVADLVFYASEWNSRRALGEVVYPLGYKMR